MSKGSSKAPKLEESVEETRLDCSIISGGTGRMDLNVQKLGICWE
jgi:hypothetical protein